MYLKFGKRLFDIAASLAGLLLLSPLLLILAALVRIKLGSPIIFSQERPGRHGKIFRLYKFRSMTDKKDEEGNPLPDSERLTSFGRALRATSLDELPELWNILKGDMSVVGPRPLLIQYLPLYNDEQKRRHNVRPGLTGHAQVNGRNAITWEEKFTLDCWYVDNINFLADVKIIFKTALKVIKRNDINSKYSVTAEHFKGGNDMDLVIVGAGGLGREVLWQITKSERLMSKYNILGFIDNNQELIGQDINGSAVLGDESWLLSYDKEISAAICIANPAARRAAYDKLKTSPHISFPSITMDGCTISDLITIGKGCIICAEVLMTVNVTIGDFVIINPRCNIAHDTKIGDFATLYYNINLAGGVRIKSGAEIGTGATIIQNKTIGEGAIIGAGAVVVKDAPPRCTAVGVPATVIKRKETW